MKSIDLQTLLLFEGCEKSFLDTLSAASNIYTYKKGKLLFIHEDPAERFFIIKNGLVKLFRETLDGTQSVIDILTTGHIFGETAIFENDQYPYSAELIETSEIISLPLLALKNEIQNNHMLSQNMLNAMVLQRRQKDYEIEHKTIQTAPQRIGCFLLRLADQNKDEAAIIHLPYDKALVAARLGMQPETFSRALIKLQEKTGIRIKGGTIEMDSLDQLTEYSCASCSSKFPCKDLQTASGD